MTNDWPCKCGHLEKEHTSKIYFEQSPENVLSSDACQICDDCVFFEPLSNLEYLEHKSD